MDHRQIEEVDVIEVLITLWRDKLTVFMMMVVGIGVGLLVSFFNPQQHQAVIGVKIFKMPVDYQQSDIMLDFAREFSNRQNFEAWRTRSGDGQFVFSDISAAKLINQAAILQPTTARLAYVDIENQQVVVRSNDLAILQAVVQYAEYISNLLVTRYMDETRQSIAFIEEKLTDEMEQSDLLIARLLKDRSYLRSMQMSTKAITISYPTMPKLTSESHVFVMTIAACLGLFIGVSFVLLRHAIVRRLNNR